MLNIFRESAKSWMIKVFIWFVALTFVGAAFLVWGQGGARREDVVATVGDIYITRAKLSEQVRLVEDGMRRQFSEQIDPSFFEAFNASAMAMNGLIDSALQINAAKSAGIGVSDSEVSAAITSMPQFQTADSFNRRIYVNTLRRNGLTTKTFEDNLKRDLMVQKLRMLIERTVTVSDAEAVDQYLSRNQPVVIEYVNIESKDLVKKVKLNDKDLREWFGNNKNKFEIPQSRTFSMLIASPEQMAASIQVSEADLKSYYEEHEAEYEIEEQVHASHILAQVSLTGSKEAADKAREKIDKALAMVEAGDDFGEVAKKMSEGPSAGGGGDLGKFSRGQMVQEFEEVAFGQKSGEVSKPFRTEFGWHIVKTISHNQAQTQTFEEVKDTLILKTREAKAWEMARKIIENIAESLTPDNFSESAESNERLEVERFMDVYKGEPILGVTEWKAVSDLVFGLEEKRVSESMELERGFAVFMVDAIKPPYTPAFETIKPRVEEQYKIWRSREITKETAERIAKAVKEEGKTIKEAAEAEGYKVSVTKPYSSASLADSKTEKDKGAVRKAFGMGVGATDVKKTTNGFLVFTVKSRPETDVKEMRAALPELRKKLITERKRRIYLEYLTALRKDAEETGDLEILIDITKRF